MKNFLLITGFILLYYNLSFTQSINSYNILDSYIPSGYMGDIKNIIIRQNFNDNTRPDSLCIKIVYSPGNNGWGGVFWQFPAGNWGTIRGKDFSNYNFTRLTFYVRGDRGGEFIKFKIGQNNDSFVSDELNKRLSRAWERITIDLRDKNLSNITGAFCWIVDSRANGGDVVKFYIDDVKLER